MPRLALDTSTFDACAAAVDAAARSLAVREGLPLATGATGSPEVEAALLELTSAWAGETRTLAEQLDAVAAALTAAGLTLASAEGDVVASLSRTLGRTQRGAH